ncbi:hypothetical protein GCM10008955_01310 [Deinococcus malanensis]|uniref:Uncharacterized protein n=1 Tax=Deinococcus malanensis TaxID=1706855 RepID=A0ABQ2EH10_9DEIO|nr:hypothetical protein [Deinococcus malanensis]GGK11804.1 hypothetical protein GCM10008955_01310 [Deinococcus malanensis]
MKTYEVTVTTATMVNFTADLGKPAKAGSQIANPGEASFRIRMTLGADTRQPMTIPSGVRWLFPSNVDRIEVLPSEDGPAWFQILATT